MRTFLVATAAVAAVALGGCSVGDEPSGDDVPSSPEASEQDVAVVDSEACDEVRTGIDAFNEGDYDGTVEHFRAALPLAEERDDGSATARDFVEAVRYYAELDAEQYPEAAATSADFAKYKAITLGQCRPAGSETTESPGTDI